MKIEQADVKNIIKINGFEKQNTIVILCIYSVIIISFITFLDKFNNPFLNLSLLLFFLIIPFICILRYLYLIIFDFQNDKIIINRRRLIKKKELKSISFNNIISIECMIDTPGLPNGLSYRLEIYCNLNNSLFKEHLIDFFILDGNKRYFIVWEYLNQLTLLIINWLRERGYHIEANASIKGRFFRFKDIKIENLKELDKERRKVKYFSFAEIIILFFICLIILGIWIYISILMRYF